MHTPSTATSNTRKYSPHAVQQLGGDVAASVTLQHPDAVDATAHTLRLRAAAERSTALGGTAWLLHRPLRDNPVALDHVIKLNTTDGITSLCTPLVINVVADG